MMERQDSFPPPQPRTTTVLYLRMEEEEEKRTIAIKKLKKYYPLGHWGFLQPSNQNGGKNFFEMLKFRKQQKIIDNFRHVEYSSTFPNIMITSKKHQIPSSTREKDRRRTQISSLPLLITIIILKDRSCYSTCLSSIFEFFAF